MHSHAFPCISPHFHAFPCISMYSKTCGSLDVRGRAQLNKRCPNPGFPQGAPPPPAALRAAGGGGRPLFIWKYRPVGVEGDAWFPSTPTGVAGDHGFKYTVYFLEMHGHTWKYTGMHGNAGKCREMHSVCSFHGWASPQNPLFIWKYRKPGGEGGAMRIHCLFENTGGVGAENVGIFPRKG